MISIDIERHIILKEKVKMLEMTIDKGQHNYDHSRRIGYG